MRKYKLHKKDVQKWTDMIYLLPTVVVVADNFIYSEKNFSIEVHFIMWHFRFLFLREKGD